jgi:hypothetical protein
MISRTDEGSFMVGYLSNGSAVLSLAGTLFNGIDLPLPGKGTSSMADLTSTVTVRPEHGPELNSFTETKLRCADALSAVIPWSFLINDLGELEDGMEMTVEKDAVLEGLTLPVDRSTMSIRVLVKGSESEGYKAVITAEGSPVPGIWTSHTMIMDSAHPWPLDLDSRAEGVYMSDDGPVIIDLRYRETLVTWSSGLGVCLNWPDGYEHTADPVPELRSASEVPPGGSGRTSHAALPSNCLAHARAASPEMAGFVDDHGPLSPFRLSYHRNDTRPSDRSWIWNITLATPPSEPVTSAVEFSVSCISGDRIGRDQLELKEVRTGRATSLPPTNRWMLTLSSHESVLRSTSLSGSFFVADGYDPSYKLDIIYRGGTGPDPMNILLQNMLGIQRSDASDIYISSSNDRFDPKTLSIAVVDGSNGQLVSTTTASGGFVVLLNTYGFELA